MYDTLGNSYNWVMIVNKARLTGTLEVELIEMLWRGDKCASDEESMCGLTGEHAAHLLLKGVLGAADQ